MTTITATKSAFVRARIEPEIKLKAESLLHAMGLNTTTLINSLYKQIIYTKSVPFSLNIPNKETVAALNTDWTKEKGYTDVDALFADMDK